MSAIKTDTPSPAQMIFADELEPAIEESLQDPAYRAALEDADHRHHLIDTLVALRKKLKLTQKEIARRMGVKQPTVSGFETEGSDPRLSTVQRYARAVEATVTFTLSTEAYCDWVVRPDGYSGSSETHNVRVADREPSRLAVGWAKSRRADFARAA